MIIIGEKINGTLPSTKKAIEEKDEAFIRDLAIRQTAAGADYIDVCASTDPSIEVATLKWLIDIVQDAVDTPLCVDSPNPRTIEQALQFVKKPGLINSVSMEGDKCDVIFPLMQGTDWQVVALTCDNHGIPAEAETRVGIAKMLVEEAQKYDITPARIHLDPLVIALSTDNEALLKFTETTKLVKELYPTIHITSGLSNISFGMPLRRIVNQVALTLAVAAGMDSAIIDPCNQEMLATLLATEALLGRDKFCRQFSNAYRNGKIGIKK